MGYNTAHTGITGNAIVMHDRWNYMLVVMELGH